MKSEYTPSLKEALASGQASPFWSLLKEDTNDASEFHKLHELSVIRRKALAAGFSVDFPLTDLRVALVGGYTLPLLSNLLQHLLFVNGFDATLFVGQFDNYVSELLDPDSDLYRFKPNIIIVLPSEHRWSYEGAPSDSRAEIEKQATGLANELLNLCRNAYNQSKAEIVLANLMLPSGSDPGAFRVKSASSEWTFRKLINLEIGLAAEPFIHICDLEFLSAQRGVVNSRDMRFWLESKQLGAADFLVDVARELCQIVLNIHRGMKKVLVLDLDNTLWGGTIGDDGIEGIELGDTSPQGQAFKEFQKYILKLYKRGVLLAICSKNNHDTAMEALQKHPEMVLRPEHFASIKANWNPKPDNLREIAAELNLGLDSFVFVDDNPSEIDIVRQFTPEVSTLLLSVDPSEYLAQLQNCRHFEPLAITDEDLSKNELYRTEATRTQLLAASTDMHAYLQSLQMEAAFQEFSELDCTRIAQLIGKSNQFNLTSKRRTNAEVRALMADGNYVSFSVRLVDRLGDCGLISVLIGQLVDHNAQRALLIDTWLMSCRVLNRGVEQEVLNEVVRLAKQHRCDSVIGTYIPSAKNSMVEDHYDKMGFSRISIGSQSHIQSKLSVQNYTPFDSHIRVVQRAYESRPSDAAIAANFQQCVCSTCAT